MRGGVASSSSSAALTIGGVNSLDPNPYRPPMILGSAASEPFVTASASAAVTSRSSGSPVAPGSFERSSTTIERTEAGSAATKVSMGKGRYKRTFTNPTRSPLAASASTV